MQTPVWQPGVSEGLCCAHPPALTLHQQEGDEVFGLVRDVRKLLLFKVPLTGQDVVQCLVVVVPQKRRQAAEPGPRGNTGQGCYCVSFYVHVYVNERLQLTACTWWRQGSTCLWGMKQTHSWWLQELKIQAFQSWPSAFPWAYTCQRHKSRNVRHITGAEVRWQNCK